jgi:pimeloyl-ACP methyl ester carboxylesterase
MSVLNTTSTVTSADGTAIACERTGAGPAVVLVDGALCSRAMGPMAALAPLLAPHFTVYRYDRRGRNASGDTLPWSADREIEDLAALIAAAGGSAHVYGTSSGAVLAADAAQRGLPISRLALYEAPFKVDGSATPDPVDYADQFWKLIADNRRGDAVRTFLKGVGVPAFGLVLMRLMPPWKKMTAVAHTLPYDLSILGPTGQGKPLPTDRWSSISVPTLVMGGGKSPTWMQNAQRAFAAVIPGARHDTLPGQTHMVRAAAIAPALMRFFSE